MYYLKNFREKKGVSREKIKCFSFQKNRFCVPLEKEELLGIQVYF